MYIGPWQEYNLSKARSSRVDAKLRPGIEQALLSTLDPATAQKAMEAMIPYFEKPSAPTQSRAGHHFHGGRVNRKRTIHTLPHIPSSLSPSPTVISARERSLQSSSPLSVRSSQSEPIRYSNAPSKVAGSKPMLEFTDSLYSSYPVDLPAIKPPYSQPAYNSPAMLNLLRLERQSKARDQIAALTGWKVDRTKSTDTESTDQRRKTQKDSQHDAKLEHVNQMKQLYLSGGADTDKAVHLPAIATKDAAVVSKLTPTNLAQHNQSLTKKIPPTKIGEHESTVPSQPRISESLAQEAEGGEREVSLATPRVGDIDLDDAAFNLISKYFQTGSGLSESNDTVLSPSHKRLLYDVKSNPHHNDRPMYSTEHSGVPISVPTTPYKGIGYDDGSQADEYLGAIDGLLMWSSQLELDLA